MMTQKWLRRGGDSVWSYADIAIDMECGGAQYLEEGSRTVGSLQWTSVDDGKPVVADHRQYPSVVEKFM